MTFIPGMPVSVPLPLLPGVGQGSTIMFIHAHPDDETIVTGATMAACSAAGARVVLVTCTRGELGEVIPAELAHLEVDQSAFALVTHAFEEQALDARGQGEDHDVAAPEGDTAPGAGLAQERERELAAALSALGVHEHMWLGQGLTAPASGPVVFRDSGMAWGADGRAMAAPVVLSGSFSREPLEQVAPLLAAAIRSLRPDVVVSYAADGGYGHPDHVRTHQLTMAALREAASPASSAASSGEGSAGQDELAGWTVPAVYAIVSDRPERPLAAGVPRIAVAGDLGAKTAAMKAHRTQITVAGERFALSDNVWRNIFATEEFVAVDLTQIYGAP
ncbi:N-acetyl-1-D-myo-inositol-2-amino-2-deoxy-alpha-D-glucopyranoside deacetylase [Arthrobacter sp. UYCu511]|uniref:PIG-L family deacetylase n=1 Tax=Arthrobacter sp. UYCu511 TaxID=3156337 RepID=UPI00339235CF